MATRPSKPGSFAADGGTTTGRTLACVDRRFRKDFLGRGQELLGTRLVRALSLRDCTDVSALPPDVCVYFEFLDILLIGGELKLPPAAAADASPGFFTTTEPERVARAMMAPPGAGAAAVANHANQTFCTADTARAAWGVEVTGATRSAFNGRDIRVAVIDSGIDAQHEAFRGHAPQLRSFVKDPAHKDHSGHGTRCASIICGQPELANNRRIGVAPEVQLFVAKIFDAGNESPDARTLAAINWALSQQCHIVSLSASGLPGASHSSVFEAAAQAAKDQGAILIAGAGNDSRRSSSRIFPVAHPANCPQILAVGAVDECLQVADFSNRGTNRRGGEIDLVAPGMQIRAAVAHGTHDNKDGTSFATPFVSGIAALWAQKNPNLRGQALWDALITNARPLPPQLIDDVGRGLVQAPS